MHYKYKRNERKIIKRAKITIKTLKMIKYCTLLVLILQAMNDFLLKKEKYSLN